MRSKEEQILELFYNSSKYWHFGELLKTAKVSRPQLAQWLKKFKDQGLIKREKPKGKMPYYLHDFHNPKFAVKKRLYALQKLASCGLLEHLASLEKAKVVILFGSFSRHDWHKDSDIDIFIYGSGENFEQGEYELKLNRGIQVHNAKDKNDLKKIDKMVPYIIAGDFLKGSIQDLGVEVHAKA